MAAQVARALEAAHAAGIVHQDVKPANVLLGFNGSVKVTDFGIAELVSTLENRTDGVWGTLGYLPPETVWEGSYDESGDVFGLGAVLYECLSGGRPAICGENADELTENTSKITPLRAGGHDVPAWIDDLVMAMLAPSRDQRIRTMKEVAGILESRAAAADWRWTANFVKESHA
jgi:serine/threonine protein kinase